MTEKHAVNKQFLLQTDIVYEKNPFGNIKKKFKNEEINSELVV